MFLVYDIPFILTSSTVTPTRTHATTELVYGEGSVLHMAIPLAIPCVSSESSDSECWVLSFRIGLSTSLGCISPTDEVISCGRSGRRHNNSEIFTTGQLSGSCYGTFSGISWNNISFDVALSSPLGFINHASPLQPRLPSA